MTATSQAHPRANEGPLPLRPDQGETVTVPMSVVAAAVAIVSIVVLFYSAFDHPLYNPDEGRYAWVSAEMAAGGSWLVPRFEGRAHLTKPPLAYWAEAGCIELLGRNEGAVRLPSLLASALTLLLVLAFARRLGHTQTAVLSVGTLITMPLFVVVSRIATTDAMLGFFWFAALTCGYFAVSRGGLRWAVLMWAAVAAGLLTKGPPALFPPALLVAWLALGRRWGDVRRLAIPVGLPLALVPLAAWVGLVAARQPDAASVWYHELVDRATGAGDHPEPVWYYLPVFFVGLFPATAMLVLPGLNIPWRRAWRVLRSGEAVALLVMAVVCPLIVFSMFSGKLATYLVPLCPPLAVLNGMMLDHWLTGRADHPRPGERPPEVVATMNVVAILVTAGCLAAGLWLHWRRLWHAAPLVVAPIACAWTWAVWKRGPAARKWALAGMWAASMLCWAWAFELEDEIRGPSSEALLIKQLEMLTDSHHPRVVTYGFSEPSLQFYAGREIAELRTPEEILQARDSAGDELVLLVHARKWKNLVSASAQLAPAFVYRASWSRWLDQETWVMLPSHRDPGPADPVRSEGRPAPPA